MKSNNIKIQDGGKTIHTVLNLLFLAIGITGGITVYLYLYIGISLIEDEAWFKVLVVLFPICIVLSLNFATVYTFEINFKKKKFRNGKRLGPFNLTRWLNLPEGKYISVFRQGYRDDDSDGDSVTTHVYDINLWYDAPHCLTITQHHNRMKALEMGTTIAGRMGIGLLDATIPNDHKWLIEMPAEVTTS